MPTIVPALTQGLIFSLLALCVAITWRVYTFPDLTVDGSLVTGGAIAIAAVLAGMHPVVATLAGMAGGFLAGVATGVLHTVLRVNRILAGILVMSALYSVNYRIMSGAALTINAERTLVTIAEELGAPLLPQGSAFVLLGQDVLPGQLVMLLIMIAVIAAVTFLLHRLLVSDLGLALRASGGNERMMRAQGVHTGRMFVLAVAIANGFAGACGAIYAQYVSSVDNALGIGMIIRGLAYVIIGQSFVRSRSVAGLILSACLGAILYELLVAVILQLGDYRNDLKLVTTLFVLGTLGVQEFLKRMRARRTMHAFAMGNGQAVIARHAPVIAGHAPAGEEQR